MYAYVEIEFEEPQQRFDLFYPVEIFNRKSEQERQPHHRIRTDLVISHRLAV